MARHSQRPPRSTPEPPPELVISTPSQVRALASGVRSAIVESLLVLGPSAVRAVAARLGRSPESLYHHMRILVRAGIVRVAEVRPAAKTRESIYALVATRLRLDRTRQSPAMRRARAAAGVALLGAAARRARPAILAGLDEGEPPTRQARVETVIVPLDAEGRRELHARFEALWAFLREHRGGRGENCAVTIAMTPARGAIVATKRPPRDTAPPSLPTRGDGRADPGRGR